MPPELTPDEALDLAEHLAHDHDMSAMITDNGLEATMAALMLAMQDIVNSECTCTGCATVKAIAGTIGTM